MSDLSPLNRSSSFLNLPREIRDAIYLFLLDYEDKPFQTVKETLSQCPEVGDAPHRPLRYQSKPASCSALLSCSKMIASEVNDLLLRRGVVYKLHAIATDYFVFAKWLSLPALSLSIRSVEVHLGQLPSKNRRPRWWGNGGPNYPTRALLQLLSLFLAYGPSLRERGSIGAPGNKKLTVETIVINYTPWSLDPHSTKELGVSGCIQVEEDDLNTLQGLLRQVTGSGLLAGRVQKLTLRWGAEQKSWDIEPRGTEWTKEIAKEWSHYGWFSNGD